MDGSRCDEAMQNLNQRSNTSMDRPYVHDQAQFYQS